jgi:uncharacterized protein
VDTFGGTDKVLDVLDREECLRLMATQNVGRLAYCVHGGARIEVVNFVVDGGGVVIRMDVGSKTIAVGRGSGLAVEADDLDKESGTGWDVTVAGPVDWVEEPAEVERLAELLQCWAPGAREHFARIRAAHVFGRRIRRVVV